ncbi:unnamed protein product [Hymenolepis diminuta]|uniref:Uncharacterized protein n=1 Tax=Hymenolepis diminuta TaxID=6216 RepID=A0A564Y754_HYMDI|nr:unnamed protein product [Hymenolepis diminuta]
MWPFDLFFTLKNEAGRSLKEAIHSKCRIKTYYELLGFYATGQVTVKDLLTACSKEIGESTVKSMNFVNVMLMFYNCCGTMFSDALNKVEYQEKLMQVLHSLTYTNNIASQKLGWFIKSIYPDSNSHLIQSLKFEGIQMSSWIPEMSAGDLKGLLRYVRKKYENNDEIKDISVLISKGSNIKELHNIHTQVEAYVKLLRIEHTFLQSVIESFLPIEYFENPVDIFTEQAIETLNKINMLLNSLNHRSDSRDENYNPYAGSKQQLISRNGFGHSEIREEKPARDQKQSNSNEYRMFEKKFIDLFGKPAKMQYLDNLINSAFDKEELDKNKKTVLEFISGIKNDYQFLNYLHKEGKIRDEPDSRVQNIIDWSQQMEQQIDYMTVAFSESEPVNSYPQTSTEPQNQVSSFTCSLQLLMTL